MPGFFQAVAAARRTPQTSGIVTAGLVFHMESANPISYPGSGTTIYDIVNSVAGTMINGPYVDGSGLLTFDGVNDRVDFPNANAIVPRNDITLNAWIYLTKYDSTIAMARNAQGGNELIFYIGPSSGSDYNKKLVFVLDGSTFLHQSVSTLNLSTWYNVCGTRIGGEGKVYINGVLDNTWTTSTSELTFATGAPLHLGVDTDGSTPSYGNFFASKIPSYMMYSRGLTAAEVLQNYNQTKSNYGL